MDRKFKQAGVGHTLTDVASGSINSFTEASKSGNREVASENKEKRRSESASKAAEAALARTANQVKISRPISSKATWKNQTQIAGIKGEAKGDKNETTSELKKQKVSPERDKEMPPMLLTILFTCPLCPACLPENEIKHHIEKCLHKDIDSEPAMVAAAMIYTLNEPKKVCACVEILNKYLDNIIKHPCEEKYRKIRVNNRVFQDKVKDLKGVKELLTMAIGFVQVELPWNDNEVKEDFYLLSEGLAMETERLEIIKDYLNEAEALLPLLDRNVKVYKPVSGAATLDFPSAFYAVSNQEIKREQQQRSENIEKSKQLCSKAMQDDEIQRKKRSYRFTLLRIRFPDDHILEGTFFSQDKFSAVMSFVKDSLEMNWLPFELSDAMGKKIDTLEVSLETLELSPAAILNFRLDHCIAEDIQAASGTTSFLMSDLLARVTEL